MAGIGRAGRRHVDYCRVRGSSAGSGGARGTPSSAATAASSPASSGTALTTAKIGGATVLTNAGGFTLYWFAPDTPAKSNCDGSCATFWPPGQGTRDPGRGCQRQARHDHPVRRHGPGHLQRASSLHLRRRHRPRPGQGQRPQRVRRGVARGHRVRVGRDRPHTVVRLRRERRLRVLTGPQDRRAPPGRMIHNFITGTSRQGLRDTTAAALTAGGRPLPRQLRLVLSPSGPGPPGGLCGQEPRAAHGSR
jgi:hypothetical protein